MSHYDVAIIGSGFAGSILARALNRRGRRVLLLERGQHPRFALGESTTPLANLALERLASRYDLPDLQHLSSHGRWLRHLPRLRRGLKRGFTFFHHQPHTAYRNSRRNEARLLVAASPDDEIADTHWLRRDVDHHLVQRAVAEGVTYLDKTEVDNVVVTDQGIRLEARRHEAQRGGRLTFEADAVVDGSGVQGVLARSLPIASRTDQIGIDSGILAAHFEGVQPFTDLVDLDPGPFPDERAAVHHLLDFGWMYVLPFDHGVTSAGLILRRDADRPSDETLQRDPAAGWRQLITRYPSLAEQFSNARAVTPIRYQARMQHRLASAAGPRWFVLPHAYAFFDPMFSTGIAWSLLAVERLADLLDGDGTDGNGTDDGDWRAYDQLLSQEADQIESLIEAAYLASDDFDRFVAVSWLYFATVSFSEVRQRLFDPAPGAAPHAWQPFLAAGDPQRGDLFRQAGNQLRRVDSSGTDTLQRWAQRRIAPFDIAGFGDPGHANLYPVDLEVLVDRAPLLGLSRESLTAMLPRLRGRV